MSWLGIQGGKIIANVGKCQASCCSWESMLDLEFLIVFAMKFGSNTIRNTESAFDGSAMVLAWYGYSEKRNGLPCRIGKSTCQQ